MLGMRWEGRDRVRRTPQELAELRMHGGMHDDESRSGSECNS